MKKTMIASAITAGLIAPFALAQQQVSALHYDYVNLDVAVGKSDVPLDGREFNFRSQTVSTSFSFRVMDQVYLAGGAAATSTDDKDFQQGRELNIDNDTFDVSARVGAFLPVLENVDLIAEAGVLHSRLDQKTRGHADYVGSGKESTTDFMWKAGFRSVWMDSFEVNVDYARADKRSILTISGPIYITENLSLDIAYSRSKNTTPGNKSETDAISVGARYYF